jgi:hypothetical protein
VTDGSRLRAEIETRAGRDALPWIDGLSEPKRSINVLSETTIQRTEPERDELASAGRRSLHGAVEVVS